MPDKPALIIPGSQTYKEEKLILARKLVDNIFELPDGSPKRWRAIEALWYSTAPRLRAFERSEAIRETLAIKRTLTDPKYGRSAATQNKGRMNGPGKNHGKAVQSLRVTGNMPESLYNFLMRFDPHGLATTSGTAGIKLRRKLYNEFREYKIPEIV